MPHEFDAFITSSSVSGLSRRLNLIFSFASLETGGNFNQRQGGTAPSFIVIEGRSYHRIRSTHANSAIRWVLHDGFEHGSAPFPNISEDLPLAWLSAVRLSLSRVNPFVHHLRDFAETRDPNATLHVQISDSGAAPEIAAVMRFENATLNDLEPRTLIIHRMDQGHTERLSSANPLWEPLVYPLLFPSGTPGWGASNSRNGGTYFST